MGQEDILTALAKLGGQATTKELYEAIPITKAAIRRSLVRLERHKEIKIISKNTCGSMGKGHYLVILRDD